MSLQELYRIDRLPVLQNRVFSTAEDARDCLTGDVVLVQDSETGLIFNNAFQPELVVYDANYNNEQALSHAFRNHLDRICEFLETTCSGSSYVEVGCGKGHFLERMRRRGNSITGLDPAYEGDDQDIRKEPFTATTEISGDVIILRHVLEHIPDPVGFLASIREANGGKGCIYIEVPCFDWILQQGAWFDVFYEHVNYFRLSDFQRLFKKLFRAEHSFGGQYLSIVADLESLRSPNYDGPAVNVSEEFTSSLRSSKDQIQEQQLGNNRSSVVWGAASKGVIFSLALARAGAEVELTIDINPAKQGKYLPCSGLPVVSPSIAFESLPQHTLVFVMNPNYLEEIRRLCPKSYKCVSA